uniref:aldo/keto reductase n=1 Tax=Enterococcus faecalis TaxID=1351 RepID=UPI0011773C7B
DDNSWGTLDAVRAIADRIGATPSQVALAWVRDQPSVTAPIIGARTMEQLRDNLGSADVVLDEDAITALGNASAPTPDDYPYGRFGVLQRKRYIDSSEQALREL